MIKQNEIHEKLVDILSNSAIYCENSILEYKIEPHRKGEWCEFLKDILGLLNSVERVDEDRFLIYGVTNDGYPKGINQDNKLGIYDDAVYQEIFEKISPRPTIELMRILGREIEVSKSDVNFYAFYIPRKNCGRVYEIGQKVKDDTSILNVGESFIRKGSRTSALTEIDRVQIRQASQSMSTSDIFELKQYDAFGISSFSLSVFLGSWDESNQHDCDFIQQLSGIPYSKWISAIRILHDKTKNQIFDFDETIWRVEDYRTVLTACSGEFSQSVVKKFLSSVERVFQQVETMNHGGEDDFLLYRYCPFSSNLIAGIAKFIGYYQHMPDYFPYISERDRRKQIKEFILIFKDLRNVNTIDAVQEIFPYLAMDLPKEYLDLIELSYRQKENAVYQFLISGNTLTNSSNLLVEGLQIAARSTGTFGRAVQLLLDIAKINVAAQNSLIAVLLPWYPQTLASADTRIGVMRRIALDKSQVGWKILLRLLPLKKSNLVTRASSDPLAWKKDDLISKEEFWKISSAYCEFAIAWATNEPEKFVDLCGSLYSFISVKQVSNLSRAISSTFRSHKMTQDVQFEIWCSIKKFIEFSEKMRGESWVLVNEDLSCMKALDCEICPKGALQDAIYSFGHLDFWRINGTMKDISSASKNTKQNRLALLNRAYEERGITVIDTLLKYAENSEELAEACSESSFSKECFVHALAFLRKPGAEQAFASKFIKYYYYNQDESWISQFPSAG